MVRVFVASYANLGISSLIVVQDLGGNVFFVDCDKCATVSVSVV